MTVTEGRAFTCGRCGQPGLRATELIEHERACGAKGRRPNFATSTKEIEAEAKKRLARMQARQTRPCPCECNSGGFCGGCGHAGCGGRR